MRKLIRKRILIIGSGASGLATCKNIAYIKRTKSEENYEEEIILEPFVFEQSGNIGGIWNYKGPKDSAEVKEFCNQIENSKNAVSDLAQNFHSAVYLSLRSNLPKDVSCFSGLPFNEIYNNNSQSESEREGLAAAGFDKERSFISHFEVYEYLSQFANKFNLQQYIHLNTKVLSVRPITSDENGNVTWKVIAEDLLKNEIQTYIFDAVLICTGHFSKKRVPSEEEIPGLYSKFKGLLMHSKDYRVADLFQSKSVVLVGSGPSGLDLSIEISKVAKEVFLCTRTKTSLKLECLGNFRQLSPIKNVKDDFHLILENDEIIFCDVIVLCTGYDYEYKFLTPSEKVSNGNCNGNGMNGNGIAKIDYNNNEENLIEIVGGQYVRNLYHQMIHPKYSTLCFVGLHIYCCPFILYDLQSQYLAKLFLKEFKLPSKEEMEREIKMGEQRLEDANLPMCKFHFLGNYQWEYYLKLTEQGDFTKDFKDAFKNGPYLYSKSLYYRSNYPAEFRNWVLKTNGNVMKFVNPEREEEEESEFTLENLIIK